jgi:hypothetical protein
MQLTHSMPRFSRTDVRFVLGALLAVAVVVGFVLSLHIF